MSLKKLILRLRGKKMLSCEMCGTTFICSINKEHYRYCPNCEKRTLNK